MQNSCRSLLRSSTSSTHNLRDFLDRQNTSQYLEDSDSLTQLGLISRAPTLSSLGDFVTSSKFITLHQCCHVCKVCPDKFAGCQSVSQI